MIVLSIVVGALVVVIGGGIVAAQATSTPDPHSPAGRAIAREKARTHRREMRARHARPWQVA